MQKNQNPLPALVRITPQDGARMRVLVTGGLGFIGTHTVKALLLRGHEARVLDNLDPQIHSDDGARRRLDPRVECIIGDVRNPDDVALALRDIDAVVHLAALTGVGQSMYKMRHYIDVNCSGTATLLDGIVRQGIGSRRFVLASSRAVYGEGAYACDQHGEIRVTKRDPVVLARGVFAPRCPACGAPVHAVPTREDVLPQAASVYALTKLQQEQQVGLAADTLGLPAVVLRYFNVYGSQQSLSNPYTGIATIFFARARAGRAIELYEGGEPSRDFVHVSDVVAANIAALEISHVPKANAAATTATFNVGSGVSTSVRRLAEVLSAAAGQAAPLVTTTMYRRGDVYACYADTTSARSALGFTARVSLEEGMREFVRWAASQRCGDHSERGAAELSRLGLLTNAIVPAHVGDPQ